MDFLYDPREEITNRALLFFDDSPVYGESEVSENTKPVEESRLGNVSNYSPEPITEENISEFSNRYISLDVLNASEGGSDLGYIRILSFKDGKFGDQIFPKAGNSSSKYKQFIVTGLTPNNSSEKIQIIKTNKTLQLYSFDSHIEMFNISGILKSTADDRWDTAMVLLWDNLLRATKLFEMNAIMEFGFESNIYWGYPINFQTQKNSNMQYIANYSMQFIVVKRSVLKSCFNDELNSLYNDIVSITEGKS